MSEEEKTDIVSRLRQTRANMLGTDDEEHYWDCHEAVEEIIMLRETLQRVCVQANSSIAQLKNRLTRLDKRTEKLRLQVEELMPPENRK